MKPITRRELLRNTLAGAGALATAPFWARATEVAAPPKILAKSAVDLVPLGRTGIRTSFLAMGTGVNAGRRRSRLTDQGEEHTLGVLRHTLDEGIRFFDMADSYGSHPYVQKALPKNLREKVTLLTKMTLRPTSWVTPSGGAKEEVDRFRKELDVEVVDVVLLHCLLNDKWPEEYERARDELSELKQQGAVRAVGCSCHDYGALQLAAEHPWVEVIFARINNVGGKQMMMDGTVEEISKTLLKARANGKAVVGMKIYGEGQLVKPEEMDASLRYVLSNNLVDAITIGMLNKEQVDDNVARVTRALKA